MGYNWNGGAQGAAGGAMAGSTFGPLGTLIGAGVGGVAGLFSNNQEEESRKRQQALFDELTGGAPAERGAYSDFRNNQRDYIRTLENQAAGRGPSVATETMKAATDRSARQASGLAQSGTGNQAAAMMMAQEASGQMGAQNAQAASAMRAQEQLNAQQQLGTAIWSGRSSDEDMNRFNASQANNFRTNNNQLRATILGSGAMNPQGPQLGEQILAGGSAMYGQNQQQKILVDAQRRQEHEQYLRALEERRRNGARQNGY
jgi:hypothetical protein